jgi:hypothetical protein
MPQFMRLVRQTMPSSPLRWIGAIAGALSLWSFLIWCIWQVFDGLL